MISKETIGSLIMPVNTDIKISSVILSDENKEKLKIFITEMNHRDELVKHGLKPINKLLFYGASGTGKTYLSKALSNYLGYTMLYVDIAKALSDNSVAQNISDIFEAARQLEKCIIFLDECDSITLSRYTSEYGDTSQVRRATNSLFQQLDQMQPKTVFIAATNLLFKIDPAFERRMDLKFEFRRPSSDLKPTIKRFMREGFELLDDVDETTSDIVAKRAERYTKLSYAEIQNIVERAMKRAVIDNSMVVRTSEIFSDLAKTMGIKMKFGTDVEPDEAFTRPKDNINN